MAYTPNVPQGTDDVNQTQQAILDNFTALNPWGNGYAAFLLQGASPFPSGSYTNGLFSMAYPTTGMTELYLYRNGTSGLTQVPFSASKMSNNAAASCDDGWTYLPSGLLMKWGAVAANSATVAITPTVTSGGPNFSRVFRVFLSPMDTGTAVNFNCGQRTVADNTSGNFNAYCLNPSGTTSIRYLVVGI